MAEATDTEVDLPPPETAPSAPTSDISKYKFLNEIVSGTLE